MNQNYRWQPSFSVGNALMDSQHKKLLEICQRLSEFSEATNAGVNEELHELLHELADYGRTHFQAEEKLLTNCNYPHLAEQQDEHYKYNVMLSQFLVDVMRRRFHGHELVSWLTQWWVSHILESDMQYKDYVK